MKALFAALFVTALAGPVAALPLPPAGPLTPEPAASPPEGERLAIWYWGVLIGRPNLCWSGPTGFYPCH
jgi:hypothetical protein